jgi:hypothetical protein
VGSASSVFLAVTALSLVIASTRTAGRPDEDDGNSDFLEYPHDPVTDAELRTRRNPWSQAFPTDGNLHRNPRVIPQPGWGHLESLHPRRSHKNWRQLNTRAHQSRGPVNVRGHFPTEAAALKCVYLAIMSLDPTGTGQRRWSNRWKPPSTPSRSPSADACPPNRSNTTRSSYTVSLMTDPVVLTIALYQTREGNPLQ